MTGNAELSRRVLELYKEVDGEVAAAGPVCDEVLGLTAPEVQRVLRFACEQVVPRIRQTGADELMVTANIFDHAKRKRSFEIVAEVHGAI